MVDGTPCGTAGGGYHGVGLGSSEARESGANCARQIPLFSLPVIERRSQLPGSNAGENTRWNLSYIQP